jgi:hypothetical protein
VHSVKDDHEAEDEKMLHDSDSIRSFISYDNSLEYSDRDDSSTINKKKCESHSTEYFKYLMHLEK